MMKKILFSLFSLLYFIPLFAQDVMEEPAATGLRADGKIYVVAAVILTIFAGMIIYMIRLDRKISRIEQQHVSNGK